MKRAFDANVSRARPRTRTTTEVVEREKEAPLSDALAAALVGRRGVPGEARRAQAMADAAGATAAVVTRGGDAPARGRDGLSAAEERLAHQAEAAAHGASRGGESSERKEGLARAMRMAAARAAEVGADASALSRQHAADAPAWVARAALPIDAEDILDEELVAAQAAPRAVAERPAAQPRTAVAERPAAHSRTAVAERPAAQPRTAVAERPAAQPRTAVAERPAAQPRTAVAERPAAQPRTAVIERPAAHSRTVAAANAPQRAPAASQQQTASRGLSAEAPSADLAATMTNDIRAAAPKARTAVATTTQQPARAESLSADMARTMATAHAGRPRMATPGEETVHQGRARIAELRGRLAAASRAPIVAAEIVPSSAAASVRRAVEELRGRLDQAIAERDTLARTLESTRDELAAANQDLFARGQALEVAQALAAERAGVADDLVAEAEALAEERDQALARILDLKNLDEQQTRLLADAQAALADRDALLEAAENELAELAGTLDARAAEIEELGALVEERSRERDQLARRVSDLEAEVVGLAGTREALAEIQRLVGNAPGR